MLNIASEKEVKKKKKKKDKFYEFYLEITVNISAQLSIFAFMSYCPGFSFLCFSLLIMLES